MFIRKKLIRGTAFYQVVESRRVEGKVRQVIIRSLAQHPTVRGLIGEKVGELRQLWRALLFCPSHEMSLSRRRGRVPGRIRELQAEVKGLAELSARLGDPIVLPGRAHRDPAAHIPGDGTTDADGYRRIVAEAAIADRKDVRELAELLGWTRHKVRMARYVAAYRRLADDGVPDYGAAILWGSLTIDQAFCRAVQPRIWERGRPEGPEPSPAPAFVLLAEWRDLPAAEKSNRLRTLNRAAAGVA